MTEQIPIANGQVNAKPQLLLHQPNTFNVIEELPMLFACFMFCLNITGCSMPTHTHTYTQAIEKWLSLLINIYFLNLPFHYEKN